MATANSVMNKLTRAGFDISRLGPRTFQADKDDSENIITFYVNGDNVNDRVLTIHMGKR